MTLPRVATCVAVSLPLALWAAPASGGPAAPAFAFDGRGAGHGVGLAQDSAQALALTGVEREAILRRFYPGTSRGTSEGAIRVAVLTTAGTFVDVHLPTGAAVGGTQTRFPAGSTVRMSTDASGYHVRQLTAPVRAAAERAAFSADATPDPSTPTPDPAPTGTATSAPSPTPEPATDASPTATWTPTSGPTTGPTASSPTPTSAAGPAPSGTPPTGQGPSTAHVDSSQPLALQPEGGGALQVVTTGRRYRGSLSLLGRRGTRTLVNALDLETYLAGLGEVPAGWAPAALQAQAVAARTYAVRARSAGAPHGYDLCADARCQVYNGVDAEDPRRTRATLATRGEILTWAGQPAEAFYSANAGGRTAGPDETLGGPAVPYLPGGRVAPGPVRPWHITALATDLARRLGYAGRLDSVRVQRTSVSGRAVALALTGTAGRRVVDAQQVRRALGLPSTLFTVATTTAVAGSGSAALSPLSASAGTEQVAPGAAAQLVPALAPELAPRTGRPTTLVPAASPQTEAEVRTALAALDRHDPRALRWTASLLAALLPLLVADRQGRRRRSA